MSCALIAETASWAKDQGKSLYEMLIDIYIEYGFYKEKLVSVVRKGKSGAEEIQNIMDEFRNNPPESINNSKLLKIKDYLIQKETDIMSNRQTEIDLPVSNVLQFYLEDHSKISVRPSGTEPKIKFYFSVKEKLCNKADFEKVNDSLDQKIDDIIKSLNIS